MFAYMNAPWLHFYAWAHVETVSFGSTNYLKPAIHYYISQGSKRFTFDGRQYMLRQHCLDILIFRTSTRGADSADNNPAQIRSHDQLRFKISALRFAEWFSPRCYLSGTKDRQLSVSLLKGFCSDIMAISEA
mgnify:FL=1